MSSLSFNQSEENTEKEVAANASFMKRSPSTDSLDGKPRSCVCAPTTHAGSFRCRLHRNMSLNNNNGHPPLPNSPHPDHSHHHHHHHPHSHPASSTVEAK